MNDERDRQRERETADDDAGKGAKMADNPPQEEGDGEKGLGTKTGGIEGGEPTEP